MKLFQGSSKKVQVSRTEALACTPLVTPSVRVLTGDNGDLMIEYPLAVKPMLQAIFNRFNKGNQQEIKRKLQLDGQGSQVWELIDGERSVQEIIQLFAKSSGLTLREAEISITAFLRELGKRGIIVLR